MYANVIIDITQEKLDRTFQYQIPEMLAERIVPGTMVDIPFGKGNRQIQGYVIEVTDKAEFDPVKIKSITAVVENKLPVEAELISLAAWIRKCYGGTMIQALKTVIPVKQTAKQKEKRVVKLLLSEEEAKEALQEFHRKRYTARERLLAELIKNKTITYEVITNKLNISKSVLDAFIEKKIVQVDAKRVYRNPIPLTSQTTSCVTLNEKQQEIVDEIWNGYLQGNKKTCLLHGVTGSGKTEVYISLIQHILSMGKQAIVLIPEIALTYQTVMRFYRCFGERVSIMNSRLSKGERYDQFARAQKGEIDIMIGPRSALFTPFAKLGIIIIDEEHEATYKSETVPKYHARETAIERARQRNAFVVLGSATPSVDAFYKASNGEYRLFSLETRFLQRALPSVYTVDLREELKQGNRSILSRKLSELMEDRLKKGEQIMLFLNRRGFAGFVSCRSCGHVMKCPHCDVSLSAHNNGRLVCHYCGYEQAGVRQCPTCGSSYIGGFRAGTQQIEEVVKKRYPFSRVLRMDTDTTKMKDGHAKILSAFSNGEADILIGTQMIVKGHDFPNVTLVGAIAADMSLYSNDYHASERTFQLLTQAAGRAGRGETTGEVVIQTYHPEHYSIVCAAEHDYASYFEKEIGYRNLLGYPPTAHMLAILIASHQEELAEEAAKRIKGKIEKYQDDCLKVIGPADASISKINDIYRKVMYCKHQNYQNLVQIKDQLETELMIWKYMEKVSIQYDFNPMNTY